MLDRMNPVFRVICLGFAALMFFQISRLAIWKNPLADVVIPNVALASTNNAATNIVSTNLLSSKNSTNNVATTNAATNAVSPKGALASASTNAASTNAASTNAASTNAASTNAASTNVVSTNLVARQSEPTNAAITNTSSTNGIASKAATTNGLSATAASERPGATNQSKTNKPPGSAPRPMSMGMNPGMRGPGMPAASLPSLIQGRIDSVIQSEILGAIMRPPPMALLGIAGKDILFRAPNGQTGLLREGEELGGVKLLQIRPNRVLIEQDGQKKELTMFEGIGSESLLPK